MWLQYCALAPKRYLLSNVRRTLSTQDFSWVLDTPAGVGTVVPCLFCDGAARGNPGSGGAGAIIMSPGGLQVLAYKHKVLGISVTNNEAEYLVRTLSLQLTAVSHLPVAGSSYWTEVGT